MVVVMMVRDPTSLSPVWCRVTVDPYAMRNIRGLSIWSQADTGKLQVIQSRENADDQ
jgi:hypothetical protein